VLRWNTAKSAAWSLQNTLGTKVDLLLKPQDLNESKSPQVRVTTAKCLYDTLLSQTNRLNIKNLGLVVCEELELLDEYYEFGLSLLLHASQTHPIRFVGLSCSINDPTDLASWLRVSPEGCYSFRPTDRDQALSITSQTFTIPPSAALFKAMAKPLYDTLRSVPQTETCVVFVPTRAQCANCARDLLRLCAVEASMRGFLSSVVEPEALEPLRGRLKDSSLVDGLMKGIGLWHKGIDRQDAQITLQLFLEGVVRVLIVPREAAWTLPARAGLVAVMGTQYINITPSASSRSVGERQITEFTLHELVGMQGRAVRHAQTGRFHIMCQAEHRDTYMRFLHDGLPLESVLVDSPRLTSVFGELRKKGLVSTKQDALDLLGFTFLARRIGTNPVYYDAPVGGRDVALSRFVDLVFEDAELGARTVAKDGAAEMIV
jgi:antiviral helicase SLH1